MRGENIGKWSYVHARKEDVLRGWSGRLEVDDAAKQIQLNKAMLFRILVFYI